MPEISQTADQTLGVLECVAAHGPITPTELAKRLTMHRPAVHRALATLHARGFVRRIAAGYLPGVTCVSIAERVEAALLAAARPVLAMLAERHGETFILTIPDGNDAVLAAQAVGVDHFVRIQFSPGFRHPLRAGASGRAILAFSESRDQVSKALAVELAKIRRQGYAVSHDELSANVHGVSVPIMRDREVVASLGVVMPSARAAEAAARARMLKTAAQGLVKAWR